MARPVCREWYPDPRPSRLLAPLLPYLPGALRLLPWLAAIPIVIVLALIVVAALPLLSWAVLSLAVLGPIAAGLALFAAWD